MDIDGILLYWSNRKYVGVPLFIVGELHHVALTCSMCCFG